MRKIILSFVLLGLLTSCNTTQKIAYVQNAGSTISYNDSLKTSAFDPRLMIGDLLIITVNANTPEAAAPFNLPLVPSKESMSNYSIGSNSNGVATTLQNYLVDPNGDINFPTLGKIHVLGMTKTQLTEYIKGKIYPQYIKEEPVISIRFANYKISVLGEVGHPGLFNINDERINIFEAIALAGDLTIFGKRDNILLIRESNGKRESFRIDLRDRRLIDSPYFYLQQNDVLYVEPNTPKTRSSALSTAETLSISVVGTLISLSSLIINIVK